METHSGFTCCLLFHLLNGKHVSCLFRPVYFQQGQRYTGGRVFCRRSTLRLWLSSSSRTCPHWKCRLSCRNHLCALDALQTPWVGSLERRSSSPLVPDEKKDDPPSTTDAPPPPSPPPPKREPGKRITRAPAIRCQFAITLSAEYISVSRGRETHMWIGDITQMHRPPPPPARSCLFSRPSALIGLWNVEKALPAPRHSCLQCNLFVFHFSPLYLKKRKNEKNKVEKKYSSSCRQTTP